MNLKEYESILEAVLFAAGEEVALTDLAAIIGQDARTTKSLINNLRDSLVKDNRGVDIIEINGSYQMCSNPVYHEYIKKLHGIPPKRTLSQTLLETLAIIAYKQPVTKNQIEQIRGVNADHAVNKLLEYNLICEKGRLDAPGKPILFATTDEFLKHFGLSHINQLPSSEKFFSDGFDIEK